MYLLIIYLPLISVFITGFFGFKIGQYGTIIISILCMFFTTILSIITFINVALKHNPCYIQLNNWFKSEFLEINWGFIFDSLTCSMLLIITLISLLVHIYSIDYLKNDPHIIRFFCYLTLFTLLMIILVTADNFVQMFIGWEGVGIVSYLLINFWFSRLQANKSAIKALLINKIGDFGLILGIIAIYHTYKSVDFDLVFAFTPEILNETFIILNYKIKKLTLICSFLLLGAIGKSAQIGLHMWLPDAMEGPTPVSALIHAATMVTAGIFLIIKCSFLFEYVPDILFIITIIGIITTFITTTISIFQNDIKRIIAYSTCSQLGYMFFSCGLSNYTLSIFHIINHAFFKALLFLCAGGIIHALFDEQDIRKMGGLVKLLPISYITMLIGSLSLIGFPFLTGFYSKDIIIELSYAKFTIDSLFIYWLSSITTIFSTFYSFRLIFFVFLNETNTYKYTIENIKEVSFFMLIPLLILSIFSIFFGYIFKDIFIGLGNTFWENSILILTHNNYIYDAEFLNYTIKLIPTIFSILGIFITIILYKFFFKFLYKLKCSFLGKKIYIFFNKKWFFDKIINDIIIIKFLFFGYNISYKILDYGFLEYLTFNLYNKFFSNLKNLFNFFNSQNIYKQIFISIYFLYLFLFVIILFLNKENFYFIYEIEIFYKYILEMKNYKLELKIKGDLSDLIVEIMPYVLLFNFQYINFIFFNFDFYLFIIYFILFFFLKKFNYKNKL